MDTETKSVAEKLFAVIRDRDVKAAIEGAGGSEGLLTVHVEPLLVGVLDGQAVSTDGKSATAIVAELRADPAFGSAFGRVSTVDTSPTNGTEPVRADMTSMDKAMYIRDHGQDAYLGLPATRPVERNGLGPVRSRMSVSEKVAQIQELGLDGYLSLPYERR